SGCERGRAAHRTLAVGHQRRIRRVRERSGVGLLDGVGHPDHVARRRGLLSAASGDDLAARAMNERGELGLLGLFGLACGAWAAALTRAGANALADRGLYETATLCALGFASGCALAVLRASAGEPVPSSTPALRGAVHGRALGSLLRTY